MDQDLVVDIEEDPAEDQEDIIEDEDQVTDHLVDDIPDREDIGINLANIPQKTIFIVALLLYNQIHEKITTNQSTCYHRSCIFLIVNRTYVCPIPR